MTEGPNGWAEGRVSVVEIQGTCDPRFDGVRQQLASNLESGEDVGASVAVVHRGELVVDLWGGTIDDDGTPWARDTIINVWSTTKTMAALCALMLVDRGELDVDAPIARYWPEFAANGKEDVLVRHALAHSAGLSGWEAPMKPEDLFDHDLCASRLAAQAPWWTPGDGSGYHAVTQGYLVGELVRRVTGVTLGTFFAKEVAGPIGADFHIGTGPEHDDRVARVIPPPPIPIDGLDESSVAYRSFINPRLDAKISWTEPWRRAEIPAANGHGNARSVALAQAAVSHGGEFRGVRLLSPASIDVILREQSYGTDRVLGVPMRLGIGYGLPSAEIPISPNPRACFWGGWGGSLVVNDIDGGFTFAYVMNRMGEGTTGDMRAGALLMFVHMGLMS